MCAGNKSVEFVGSFADESREKSRDSDQVLFKDRFPFVFPAENICNETERKCL
jgi:hypothetical protein